MFNFNGYNIPKYLGNLKGLNSTASEIDVAIESNYVNVKDFGAVGDGVTNDTIAFENARNFAHYNKRGGIFVPAGKYRLLEFNITGNNCKISMCGVFGATEIYSAEDYKFAIICSNNVFLEEPYFTPFIKNIGYNGTINGVARKGCGFYLPREIKLENIGMTRALIGCISGDNYYFGWRNINASYNDIGCLIGTFAAGNTTISNLVDGLNNNCSVTIPFPMNNAAGHSGNKKFDILRVVHNRIGLVFYSQTSFSPYMTIDKFTAEYNDIGILNANAIIELNSAYTENNSKIGSLVLNGVTFNKSSITMTSISNNPYYDIGSKMIIKNSKVEDINLTLNSSCTINENSILYSVQKDLTSSIILDDIFCDNVSISQKVKSAYPLFGNGRAVHCFLKNKTRKLNNQKPDNGDVLIFDDFQGNSIVSPRLSWAGVGSKTFNVVDGLLELNRCMEIVVTNGNGFNLLVNGVFQTGKYYLLSFGVKTPIPIRLATVNIVDAYDAPSNNLIIPLDKWTTVCMFAQWSSASGTPRITFNDIVGNANIRFSGFSLLEFSNPKDAKDFMENENYYVTEKI